ncbi:MAG TPA: M48 family metallopeptidase [Nitrospira sp.]|nr:M48 family metallopeptidase [Nitrospira sp.]
MEARTSPDSPVFSASASPNALCFGDDLPATGAPCLVDLDTSGITVHLLQAPPIVLRVKFDEVSVSAGGLDHDQLVAQWTGEQGRRSLYIKDPVLIRAFRAAAPPGLTRRLDDTAAAVRRTRTRQRSTWAAVGGALVAVVLVLWFGSDLLVEMAVSRIPVEWEQKIGEAAYRDVLAQQTVIKEGPAVSAVQEMTRRLTERLSDSPYKFEVTMVKNDVVNAFALPGGYVVVFTGLMKNAESGEEVAGVLSHELNHVLQRHGLERIVKQLGLFTVLSVIMGNQQGLAGLMREVSLQLLTLRFGRDQETEADVTGVHLLHRARIDPEGLIRFFDRLSAKEKDRVELLSTHPMSQARAARLRTEVASLPKQLPEPFTFDWKSVQQSLAGP